MVNKIFKSYLPLSLPDLIPYRLTYKHRLLVAVLLTLLALGCQAVLG